MAKYFFHLVLPRLLVLLEGTLVLLVDSLTLGPSMLYLVLLRAALLVNGALLRRLELVLLVVLAVHPGRLSN